MHKIFFFIVFLILAFCTSCGMGEVIKEQFGQVVREEYNKNIPELSLPYQFEFENIWQEENIDTLPQKEKKDEDIDERITQTFESLGFKKIGKIRTKNSLFILLKDSVKNDLAEWENYTLQVYKMPEYKNIKGLNLLENRVLKGYGKIIGKVSISKNHDIKVSQKWQEFDKKDKKTVIFEKIIEKHYQIQADTIIQKISDGYKEVHYFWNSSVEKRICVQVTWQQNSSKYDSPTTSRSQNLYFEVEGQNKRQSQIIEDMGDYIILKGESRNEKYLFGKYDSKESIFSSITRINLDGSKSEFVLQKRLNP